LDYAARTDNDFNGKQQTKTIFLYIRAGILFQVRLRFSSSLNPGPYLSPVCSVSSAYHSSSAKLTGLSH
jgi:hypothetical protein